MGKELDHSFKKFTKSNSDARLLTVRLGDLSIIHKTAKNFKDIFLLIFRPLRINIWIYQLARFKTLKHIEKLIKFVVSQLRVFF